jgi:hypothetical protein
MSDANVVLCIGVVRVNTDQTRCPQIAEAERVRVAAQERVAIQAKLPDFLTALVSLVQQLAKRVKAVIDSDVVWLVAIASFDSCFQRRELILVHRKALADAPREFLTTNGELQSLNHHSRSDSQCAGSTDDDDGIVERGDQEAGFAIWNDPGGGSF